MKKFLLFSLLILVYSIQISAKTKIAVLPFQNMDGDVKFNIYAYQLQDSIFKSLMDLDIEGQYYELVPLDDIESVLSEMNLDPTNPQYPTDLWKAVSMLDVQKVISGNFNYRAERFLINAYIYDVDTKLADMQHQARDIFRSEEEILSAVRIIIRRISPGLIPKE